jgi:hypothetical protein
VTFLSPPCAATASRGGGGGIHAVHGHENGKDASNRFRVMHDWTNDGHGRRPRAARSIGNIDLAAAAANAFLFYR